MRSPRRGDMQGTTSFRVLAFLFFGLAAGTAIPTTTITSTKILPTNTITVTIADTQSSSSPTPDALAAVHDWKKYTATSTITQTTTVIMAPTNSLASAVLNSTNYYRAQHLAAPVEWNDTLADFAQDWAKGCVWKHSGGPYGENLAANFESETLGIDAWAREEDKYNYAKGKFTEGEGHFTQLVWQNTTSVGCAVVDCNNDASDGVKGAFLVCEYSPPGNVKGQFRTNVRKPGISEDGTLGFGSAAVGRSVGGGWTVRAVTALVVVGLWVGS